MLRAATRDLTGVSPAVPPSREDLIRARQGRLQERVAHYGLLLDPMANDGNCLFRAVSRQLYGNPAAYGLVRHRVVDQLYKDRSVYAPFFGELAEFEDIGSIM